MSQGEKKSQCISIFHPSWSSYSLKMSQVMLCSYENPHWSMAWDNLFVKPKSRRDVNLHSWNKKFIGCLTNVKYVYPRCKWLNWQLLNIMHLFNSGGSIFYQWLCTVSISSRYILRLFLSPRICWVINLKRILPVFRLNTPNQLGYAKWICVYDIARDLSPHQIAE